MKILSIDTAHGICSAALAEGGNIISAKTDNEPSKQAERLFLTINTMLEENNLAYPDINAIAADIGPGSFTGVRIGLAATRGIALAGKIPVIGVTGFEALSHTAFSKHGLKNILVVFDAKRGQVFTQFFSGKTVGEPVLMDYNQVTSVIQNSKDITIIGDGASLVTPFLQETEIKFSIIDNMLLPDASMVALKAFEKINNGNYSTNPAPLYIRKPDAKLPKSSGVQ